MFFIALFLALTIAVGADVYDVTMTEKGIAKGVAVEGFDWLVGQKPRTSSLYLRDLTLIALATTPALIIYLCGNAPAGYGCLAAPLAVALRHFLGGRAWAKLLK